MVQVSAVAAGRDMPEVGTSPDPDTLTKSDRLPVTYIGSVVPVAVEPQLPEPPPKPVPEIISRHWHDPSDSRAAQRGTKKITSKDLRKHVRRIERKPQAPVACNPDESSPLRRLFGAATVCSN